MKPRQKNKTKKATYEPLFAFTVNGASYAMRLGSVEGITKQSDVVPVPGNKSRSFLGLSYLMGQLVSIIDIAPLMNTGAARKTGDVLLFRYEKEYYGILIDSVIGVLEKPSAKHLREKQAISRSYCAHGKIKIYIVDIQKLIVEYICR
jgi:chemotaxis signal transduction protein